MNEVVPYEKLDAAVQGLCEKLINKFPDCMRNTKVQCNFWGDLAWTTLQHARNWLAIHYAIAEPIKGFSAFLEKRKVDYWGMRQKSADGGSHSYIHGAPFKNCAECDAKYMPEDFSYCGKCGAELEK